MNREKFYFTSILAAVFGGLFINLLSEAIKYLVDRAWGKPLDPGQRTIVWMVAVLILGGILWLIFTYILTDDVITKIIKFLRPQFLPLIQSTQESATRERVMRDIEEKTGIVNIYNSMNDAISAMKQAIEQTHDLKILSNKGTDWIGDDNAVLSNSISKRAMAGLKVRILLLSKDAPWLNIGWATQRGKPSLQFVKSEFDTAHKLVESYFEKHGTLKHKSGIRYHRDDPIWRFVMTDERIFVSSYASTDQARDGLIFEFKGPNNEFYQAYKRYFNFLWHRRGIVKSNVEESEAKNVRYDEFELSAGGIVYAKIHGERKVLVVKQLKEGGGLFTLPKGHLKGNERPSEAAIREIIEETGLSQEHLVIDSGLGWFPNPILIGDKTRVFKIVYYYLVRYVGTEFPSLTTDVDHESAQWVSIDEVDKLRFAYTHIERVLLEAFEKIK